GAYDYLLKPFDVPRLKQIVFGALQAARAMKQVVSYPPLFDPEDHELGIIGRSEAMQKVYKLIGQLATSDATALITGESGTGKELVARAIYQHSQRSAQPYLAINCAAIPENLLESELFGHERGAFTGAAAQRIGKFEQCHRGTLFLDEIGDMTHATQTRVLRVLQSGRFERVGGNQPIQVDVRVIAATNKGLEAAVAAREFREDLYYRLNVVRVELPPLRERREDIARLAHYFLERIGGKSGRAPALAAQSLKALEQYHWPGNVRELENAMQRATVVAKGNVILPGDLPLEIVGQRDVDSSLRLDATGKSSDLNALGQKLFQWARRQPDLKVLPAIERELIIQALIETNGNQIQAAKLLGITRATLRKRVEKFKIKREVAIK
ncbi:MAG: sigma-54 dependent transcriptional regulator, partial [Verrucomicrobiota bacterium]